MTKVVKVGMMPGQIKEFAVDEGTPIGDVIALASLDPVGYDVKVDGNKCTDLQNTYVTANTNLILLAKQVKGN